MPRLRFAIPFALLSLPLLVSHAKAHEGHDHAEHGSLGAHVHGVASLNIAIEGEALEIALDSPAMNLVGFEHTAASAEDKAKVQNAREQLQQGNALFGLPAEAKCELKDVRMESALFEEGEAHAHGEHMHGDEHSHGDAEGHADHDHSDIEAEYSFTCANAGTMTSVDLSGFFKQFPATEKVNVQAIGANGQKGETLTAAQPRLTF